MKTKHWKTAAIFGFILLFIVAVGTANASVKYGSQTGEACAACHDMAKLPALNALGEQYKTNGYKLPAEQPSEQPAAKPAPKPTVKPAPKKATVPYAEYIGSERCGKCHADYYKNWQNTYHSKMVTKRDKGILKDAVFSWAYDLNGNKGPTIGNATKESLSILDVEYVVGSKWKQRYLVRNPKTGGLQLMDKQFNVITKQWESYTNASDWDTNCITCHSTGYRLTAYDENNPSATKWAVGELNVGCEACHGPGSLHANSGGKTSIFNPAKQPKEVQARLCGYCHSRFENEQYLTRQGKPREDLPSPQLNISRKPWDDWTKWYPEELIAPGLQADDKVDAAYTGDLKDLFFNDAIAVKQGVFEEKKHHQEYQGFIQSKHYTKLTCTTCHNPHKRSATSGSLKSAPADLCAKCHGETYDWQKVMPGLGKTANNLYVRTHTFIADQTREDAGKTAYGIEQEYYFKK